MTRKTRVLFWVLLTVTLAARLPLLFAETRALAAQGLYPDDAFYYLKIARNFIEGEGMTFDGIHATTGFQPLYFILMLPVMAFAGDDLSLAIRLSLILLILCSLACAWLVFRVTSRLSDDRATLAALSVWALSPYFIQHGINGLETGLAMLFALWVVDGYLKWFRGSSIPTAWQAFRFGLICGLAFLARIDLILLLVALLAHWTWTHRGSLRVALRASGFAFVAATLVVLPWCVESRVAGGHWLPTSGRATRLIALNLGWVMTPNVWRSPGAPPVGGGGLDSLLFDPDHPPTVFYADVATRLVFLFAMEQPLLAPLRANVAFDYRPSLRDFLPYASFARAPAFSTILLAVLGFGLCIAVTRMDRRGGEPGFGGALMGYLLLFLVGYTFYSPAAWYFSRYLATPVLLTTLWGIGALGRRLKRTEASGGSAFLRSGFAPVFFAIVMANAYGLRFHRSLFETGGDEIPFLRQWSQMAPQIPSGEKIGAFNAGYLACFSRAPVINLDGKVNDAAYSALRDKRLHEYIRKEGIRYIVDSDVMMAALCLRNVRGGLFRGSKLVSGEDEMDGSLFYIDP